jgi:hypothetical protein
MLKQMLKLNGYVSFSLSSRPNVYISYSSFVRLRHFSGSSATSAKLGSIRSVLFSTENVKGLRLNILVQNVF